ncbi:hypothetical protein [Pseudarthrobacter sp. NPDC080039]|uniref:hypothetical protein n=1 Tax=unclassified Pseudarthrobacter TaxID=2647000 RepID=UPI00344EE323
MIEDITVLPEELLRRAAVFLSARTIRAGNPGAGDRQEVWGRDVSSIFPQLHGVELVAIVPLLVLLGLRRLVGFFMRAGALGWSWRIVPGGRLRASTLGAWSHPPTKNVLIESAGPAIVGHYQPEMCIITPRNTYAWRPGLSAATVYGVLAGREEGHGTSVERLVRGSS